MPVHRGSCRRSRPRWRCSSRPGWCGGDAQARASHRPPRDGGATGDSRRAPARSRAAAPAPATLVLRRGDPLQPDRAVAERPLRRAGTRRLFVRGHVRALPAARGSVAVQVHHRPHRPRRSVGEAGLGAALVPPEHDDGRHRPLDPRGGGDRGECRSVGEGLCVLANQQRVRAPGGRWRSGACARATVV